MSEDWLSDEIRSRSAMFWHRRNSWPIEAQGHLLLANAMLRVGAALFGEDWRGDEPHRAWLPVFSRELMRPIATQGFDAVYAEALLAAFNPTALTIPKNENRNFYANPLTDDEWNAAFDAYERYDLERNMIAMRKVRHVSRLMIEAFANEVLVSAVRKDGVFSVIPAAHWNDEDVGYARFIESQMNPATPFEQNWPTIYEAMSTKFPPMLVPGNTWIFVTQSSLDVFVGGLKRASKAPAAPTRHYSDEAIDTALKALYAAVAASGEKRPIRDGPGGVVDIMRQRLPGVPVDRVKERYKETRPESWKQGKSSLH